MLQRMVKIAPMRYTILWLAVMDWDGPWQGQQALASRLAAAGHSVTFVETPGIRSATGRDWPRLVRRLRKRLRGGLWGFYPLAENLWLHPPVLLPFPGRPWADALNRRLLLASLRRTPAPGPDAPLLLWTYLPTPLVVRLVQDLRPARLVYYCIDDVARNPKGAAPGIPAAEDRLLRQADQVFVTSRRLYAERQPKNPNITYLPEAADIGPFITPTAEAPDLAPFPRPRIGFFGTLDARLDLDLIARIAQAYPQAAVILIGPIRTDLGPLRRLPNIHLLGARPHEDLPAYVQHMDVLIIPYRLTPYTQNVHPVKTYEALATGRPLVTTALPELQQYAGVITVAEDADAFLEGIAAGLAEADPALVRARQNLARQNTWDARYRVILEKLPDLA